MTRYREVVVWLAPPAAIALLVWAALASPQRAFSVPVNQSPSVLLHLAQVKGVLDGRPQSPRLPWMGPVDVAVVRGIGLTGAELGGSANASWVVTLMVGGMFAAWGFRRLGLSITGACVLSVLYGLSPYALYWNIEEPGVMPFLVPFAATAALVLATGAIARWPRRHVLVLLAGLLLLGLNGREYAYFGAGLTAIGAIIGMVRSGRLAPSMRHTVVTAVVVGATVVSLTPALRAPKAPDDPSFRVTAGDTEASGVKFRQLIGPLPWHWLPPFSQWSRAEGVAGFPFESSNHLSRLGVVAGVGFLALIAVLLVPAIGGPPPDGETVRSASGLTLAGFLFATVGGIGAIISLFIEPVLLTFNRITPFFIFFSLAAVGVWVDRAATRRRLGELIWIAVAVFALLDQMVAVRPLHRGVTKARIEYRQLQGFVEVLERQLPDQARVYQLPDRSERQHRRMGRMLPNEDVKPYLVSRQLRWRYPVLTPEEAREDELRDALEPNALAPRLAQDGFAAIVVDRLGYDDNGKAVQEALLGAGVTGILAETDRYVAFLVRK